MDEPLAELAAYFRRKARLPDQELIRLTAAARAGASLWDVIAAACGIRWQHTPMLVYDQRGNCTEDITQISCGEAEQIAAGLAARYWPPEAVRLPWVLSAYPDDIR